MIEFLIAILAGVLTVGAPCILPILPILLGYSINQTSKTRPLFITFGFILSFTGLALVFAVFTNFLGLSSDTLRRVAIFLLALFGLLMIWPAVMKKITAKLEGLTSKAQKLGQKTGNGNWGGLFLGLILGIVWAPCAGPVLGSILTLVITQTDLSRAGILLFAYSIGAGIPMLLIAYGGQIMTTKVRKIAQYSVTIQKVFGVVIIFIAISMYFGYDLIIQAKLLEFFPGGAPML
jgi:cytochrome c-type biogenesis protein